MKLDPDKTNGPSKYYQEIGPYVGLGIQLAASVTISVFIGIWLDEQFETSPVLTIVFAFFGVFAGMYNFIKSVLRSDDDKK